MNVPLFVIPAMFASVCVPDVELKVPVAPTVTVPVTDMVVLPELVNVIVPALMAMLLAMEIVLAPLLFTVPVPVC